MHGNYPSVNKHWEIRSNRKKCPYLELFWFTFSRIWTRITPNTDTFYDYSVSLRIQSECRKIRTRITPNTDTFYVVALKRYSTLKWGKINWKLQLQPICSDFNHIWHPEKVIFPKIAVFLINWYRKQFKKDSWHYFCGFESQ